MVNRKRPAWYKQGGTGPANSITQRNNSATNSLPASRTTVTDEQPILTDYSALPSSAVYKDGVNVSGAVHATDHNLNNLNSPLSETNMYNGTNSVTQLAVKAIRNQTNIGLSSATIDNNEELTHKVLVDEIPLPQESDVSGGATPTRDENLALTEWHVVDNVDSEYGPVIPPAMSMLNEVSDNSISDHYTAANTVIDEVGSCDTSVIPSDESDINMRTVDDISTRETQAMTHHNASSRSHVSSAQTSDRSAKEHLTRRFGSVESNHSSTTHSSEKSNHSNSTRQRDGSSDHRTGSGSRRPESGRRSPPGSRKRIHRSRTPDRNRKHSPQSRRSTAGQDAKVSAKDKSTSDSKSVSSSRHSQTSSSSRDSRSRRTLTSPERRTSKSTGREDKQDSKSSRSSKFIDRGTMSKTMRAIAKRSDGKYTTKPTIADLVSAELNLLRRQTQSSSTKSFKNSQLMSTISWSKNQVSSAKSSGSKVNDNRSHSSSSAADRRNDKTNSTSGVSSSVSSTSKKSKTAGSHYSRAKSVFTARSRVNNGASNKATTAQKSSTRSEAGGDADVARRLNQAKILDGVGLQKIRVANHKSFLKQYIEEYYMESNGNMAEGMMPLMAFKIGNPQFVSEFLEKKTEIAEAEIGSENIQRNMKERFVFKTKIGLENLDKLVTEGLTASAQNEFFLQNSAKFAVQEGKFKNAVMLYRYSDVCLAWVRDKLVPKNKPIFLLVFKVVYGRMKTYQHLSDKQFVKPAYKADMLRVSMRLMQGREFHSIDEKIRMSLSCSKAIFTDTNDLGQSKDRPRQVLPYAIVLYGHSNYTEDTQADLKQTVLHWKKNFEMQRWQWRVAASEILAREQMMKQMQREQVMQREQAILRQQHQQGLLLAPRLPLQVVEGYHQPMAADNATRIMTHPPHPVANLSHQIEHRTHHVQYISQQTFQQPHGVVNKRMQGFSNANLEPLGIPPVNGVKQIGLAAPLSKQPAVSRANVTVEQEKEERAPSPKRPRVEEPVPAKEDEIDKIVEEIVASRRAAVKTADVGVQVKTQSAIISLQRKNVSLTASTQTPNIDVEDSYEAMLMRGGPLIPKPTAPLPIVCAKCKNHLNEGQDTTSAAYTPTARVLVNKSARRRQFTSLSSRFTKMSEDYDLFADEDEEANSAKHTRSPVTAPQPIVVNASDTDSTPTITSEALRFLSASYMPN